MNPGVTIQVAPLALWGIFWDMYQKKHISLPKDPSGATAPCNLEKRAYLTAKVPSGTTDTVTAGFNPGKNWMVSN
jgi:hypothetical protein